jgi:hypothetical protein
VNVGAAVYRDLTDVRRCRAREQVNRDQKKNHPPHLWKLFQSSGLRNVHRAPTGQTLAGRRSLFAWEALLRRDLAGSAFAMPKAIAVRFSRLSAEATFALLGD